MTPFKRAQINIEPGEGSGNLYDQINALHAKLTNPKTIQPHVAQPAVPSREIVSDSGAETGLKLTEEVAKNT